MTPLILCIQNLPPLSINTDPDQQMSPSLGPFHLLSASLYTNGLKTSHTKIQSNHSGCAVQFVCKFTRPSSVSGTQSTGCKVTHITKASVILIDVFNTTEVNSERVWWGSGVEGYGRCLPVIQWFQKNLLEILGH